MTTNGKPVEDLHQPRCYGDLCLKQGSRIGFSTLPISKIDYHEAQSKVMSADR